MPDYRDLNQVVFGVKTLEEVLPTKKDQEYWLKARKYCSLLYRAMTDEHAKRLAARQNDVYVYSFCWGTEEVTSKIHGFTFGAAHCLDLPFLFRTFDKNKEEWLAFSPMFASFAKKNRPGRQALSEAMISYLAQFMRTGNPNNAISGLPEWKAWSNHAGGPKAIRLDADLQQAQITMDTQELSVSAVRRALDTEPAELRKHVLAVASVIMPFIVYEPGAYEFDSDTAVQWSF